MGSACEDEWTSELIERYDRFMFSQGIESTMWHGRASATYTVAQMPRPSSRLARTARRLEGLLYGTGCGGGSFTAPPSVSGQTPPGSYNILVQGTGTDHQTYQAVIQVNVTR